ncbi:unnamed protein product [Pedinophyceae sp. YPF-701]|nr:unnamed protein product [Pedinophyceae sp. YPF-701]
MREATHSGAAAVVAMRVTLVLLASALALLALHSPRLFAATVGLPVLAAKMFPWHKLHRGRHASRRMSVDFREAGSPPAQAPGVISLSSDEDEPDGEVDDAATAEVLHADWAALSDDDMAQLAFEGEGAVVLLPTGRGLPHGDVTREHVRCLRPHGWINDEVVNGFVRRLRERDAAWRVQPPPGHTPPRVVVMDSFWFTRVAPDGTERTRGYSYGDLVGSDLVLVPVHDSGSHWALAVVDFDEPVGRLWYYDSLHQSGEEHLERLSAWVAREASTGALRGVWQRCGDVRAWTRGQPARLPRQRNGYDCGAFMLCFMEELARWGTRGRMVGGEGDWRGGVLRRRVLSGLLRGLPPG